MADIPAPPKRKSKLPPLEPNAEVDETIRPKKKVARKKKKPAEGDEEDIGGDKPKPVVRRKKAASADSKAETGGEVVTPKKKKRVVKKTEDPDADQTSARSASQGEVSLYIWTVKEVKNLVDKTLFKLF